MQKIFLIVLVLILITNNNYSQNIENKGEKKSFIYILKLTPNYFEESNWKEEDNKAVREHFVRFQNMLKEGILVLAGRTEVELRNTFGIAVYYADSFEEARKIAEDDPAVISGIMTVEVFPFNVALLKGEKEK